jgi:hypothetical protein
MRSMGKVFSPPRPVIEMDASENREHINLDEPNQKLEREQ